MTAVTARILGRTEPRLYTPPQRKLTRRTSYGYAVVDFARDILGEALDPWQEWLVIHAGERLTDGRPRFRQVVILVARQAGKTHLCKTLALYWLFEEKWPLVVSMSTTLQYAQEAWSVAVAQAEATEVLAEAVSQVRLANGEQHLTTVDHCRYKIAASNRRGGRGLSIDRLILDELREHDDWTAWSAAVPAMNARPKAQIFAISSQGDETAVVLESLRSAALEFIETGEGDDRLGLFEWSAPDGCEVDDPEAWAYANPTLGRLDRVDASVIAGPAMRAKAAGGEEEASFRIEILCQRVRQVDPAIAPAAWARSLDRSGLDDVRDRVVTLIDVSTDQLHATLYAAAQLADGRVRIDFVRAWEGADCLDQARRELADLLEQIKPRVFGWLPGGPAATITPDMRKHPGWPPRGVRVVEVKTDLPAVCMGFAEQVAAGRILHSGDPLLDAQVAAAQRLRRGDVWVFSRRGDGHCDAVYAAAGAVWLARTLPARPRAIVMLPRLPA